MSGYRLAPWARVLIGVVGYSTAGLWLAVVTAHILEWPPIACP